MRIVLVAAAVAACGGGGGGKGGAAAGAPVEEGLPVRIELGWVVASAPTEVKEVECKLMLRVVRAGGAASRSKEEMHEMGLWWRAQIAAVEMVAVKHASGPVFFRTDAVFGSDGDLTKGPEFEVVRDPDGAVIVRGRDEDTPWRQLERIEVPPQTPVEARVPPPPTQ